MNNNLSQIKVQFNMEYDFEFRFNVVFQKTVVLSS